MDENTADLIARISIALERVPDLIGAFLGGSHGRGEADEFSDVDVYGVVADSASVSGVVNQLSEISAQIAPILYSKILPNARTINCITTDWQRFDLTVVIPFELAILTGGEVRPLFDSQGIGDVVSKKAKPPRPPSSEEFIELVNEFIRVLGLSVIAKGRDDLIVAQKGTTLLLDMLIQMMNWENGTYQKRGVLSVVRYLKPDQSSALACLPALDANWHSVFKRTRAIAREFFPRARAASNILGATWPETFEQVTRKHVAENLGFDI